MGAIKSEYDYFKSLQEMEIEQYRRLLTDQQRQHLMELKPIVEKMQKDVKEMKIRKRKNQLILLM